MAKKLKLKYDASRLPFTLVDGRKRGAVARLLPSVAGPSPCPNRYVRYVVVEWKPGGWGLELGPKRRALRRCHRKIAAARATVRRLRAKGSPYRSAIFDLTNGKKVK